MQIIALQFLPDMDERRPSWTFAQMRTAVLYPARGVSVNTTVHWSDETGRSWSRYAAQVRHQWV